jgi:hypothetical protein
VGRTWAENGGAKPHNCFTIVVANPGYREPNLSIDLNEQLKPEEPHQRLRSFIR